MEGWIKLHRKIVEWKYFKNSEIYHVFTALVLMANHKDGFTQDGTLIKRGQLMTSYASLKNQTGLSESKIFRIIEKLKIEKQIEKQGSNKNTIISIINYDDYQDIEIDTEKQMKSKRKASEKQVKTNKNAKNVKNEKNNITVGFFEHDEIDPNELTPKELVTKVLTALNAICFTNHRPNKVNCGHINARISEGYTYEDFLSVIKHKHKEWGNSTRMAQYLRPRTLFCSNFDDYLQAAKNADKPKIDPLDALFEPVVKAWKQESAS